MRIAWLAPYPASLLVPELHVDRHVQAHASSWIVNLANALAARPEIQLHIVAEYPGVWGGRTVVRNGITFHICRHAFPMTLRGFPSYLPLDTVTRYIGVRRSIRAVLNEISPDLVHVHGMENGYGLAALDAGFPFVISVQGIIARYIEVEHSLFYRLHRPVETEIVRRSRFFGTRTSWATDFVKEINPSAVCVDMPEAMHPCFFASKGADPSAQRILFVGNIGRRKGVEVLIRSLPTVLAQKPEVRLTIVGTGKREYITRIKRQARALGVDTCIEWKGSKTSEDVARLHAMSSVLALPTLMDNSPNALAEGLVSGLPVVASCVGGIPSMVDNNKTAILVEPGDPMDLAQGLIRLLEDRALAAAIAQNARRAASVRYEPSIVAARTAEAYREVLELW